MEVRDASTGWLFVYILMKQLLEKGDVMIKDVLCLGQYSPMWKSGDTGNVQDTAGTPGTGGSSALTTPMNWNKLKKTVVELRD